jgi:photosystem II stability/assembly factor-like uncharacterized protein
MSRGLERNSLLTPTLSSTRRGGGAPKCSIIAIAALALALTCGQTRADWHVLYSFDSITIHAMQFPTPETGYLASDGVVMRTTDAGNSWVPETLKGFFPPPQFFSMVFPDADTGYYGSMQGRIYKTTNSGATWGAESQDGYYENIVSLSFPSNGTVGFGLGMLGRLIQTTDGGATWTRMNSPDTLTMMNVVRFNTNAYGFVAGMNSMVYRTTNGGSTWLKVVTSGSQYDAFSFPTSMHGFASTSLG